MDSNKIWLAGLWVIIIGFTVGFQIVNKNLTNTLTIAPIFGFIGLFFSIPFLVVIDRKEREIAGDPNAWVIRK